MYHHRAIPSANMAKIDDPGKGQKARVSPLGLMKEEEQGSKMDFCGSDCYNCFSSLLWWIQKLIFLPNVLQGHSQCSRNVRATIVYIHFQMQKIRKRLSVLERYKLNVNSAFGIKRSQICIWPFQYCDEVVGDMILIHRGVNLAPSSALVKLKFAGGTCLPQTALSYPELQRL